MWAALFAAIEAVPILLKQFNAMVVEWQLWQLSKIDQIYSKKDEQRKALLNVLKKEGVSDGERKSLVRLLYDLNHNP
jgi:hypothetical protein